MAASNKLKIKEIYVPEGRIKVLPPKYELPKKYVPKNGKDGKKMKSLDKTLKEIEKYGVKRKITELNKYAYSEFINYRKLVKPNRTVGYGGYRTRFVNVSSEVVKVRPMIKEREKDLRKIITEYARGNVSKRVLINEFLQIQYFIKKAKEGRILSLYEPERYVKNIIYPSFKSVLSVINQVLLDGFADKFESNQNELIYEGVVSEIPTDESEYEKIRKVVDKIYLTLQRKGCYLFIVKGKEKSILSSREQIAAWLDVLAEHQTYTETQVFKEDTARVSIYVVKYPKRYGRRGGFYYKYRINEEVEIPDNIKEALNEIQIYGSNIDDNDCIPCLINSIYKCDLGLELDTIIRVVMMVDGEYVSKRALPYIASELKINISVTDLFDDSNNRKREYIINDEYKTASVCFYDDHYIINRKYARVFKREEFGIPGKGDIRSTGGLLKAINKSNFIRPATQTELESCVFKFKSNFDNIIFKSGSFGMKLEQEIASAPKKMKEDKSKEKKEKKEKKEHPQLFADFETTTLENGLIYPYSCSWVWSDDEEVSHRLIHKVCVECFGIEEASRGIVVESLLYELWKVKNKRFGEYCFEHGATSEFVCVSDVFSSNQSIWECSRALKLKNSKGNAVSNFDEAKIELNKFYNSWWTPDVYFHNAKFDMGCLLSSKDIIKVEEVIGNFGSLKACTVTAKTRYIYIRFRVIDSYSKLPLALDSFGSAFGLSVCKGDFPHLLTSTESNIKGLIERDWKISFDEFYDAYSRGLRFDVAYDRGLRFDDDDLDTRLEVKSWVENANSLLPNGCVDLERYLKFYNNQDVLVLKAGFYVAASKNGESWKNTLTIGAMSLKSAKLETRFGEMDDCKLHGDLSEYIRKSLFGGLNQIRDSKTIREVYDEKSWFCDLDINSLYPWACTQRFPTTKCKFASSNRFEELRKENKLFICTIQVLNNPTETPISFLKDENGDFIHGKGSCFIKNLVCSNIFLEVLLLHHGMRYGVDYKLVDGSEILYFEKSDYIFKDWINSNYKTRKEAARTDAALSNCCKLKLNSLWGKFAQRTFNNQITVLPSEEAGLKKLFESPWKWYKLSNENGRWFMTGKKNFSSKYSSYSHLAMFVLDYSKLMLAQHINALDSVGGIVLYTDTDSMHTKFNDQSDIEKYREVFINKFGFDPMGLDCNGHDILGGVKNDISPPKIYKQDKGWKCVESIFYAKKVYCHCFRSDNGNIFCHYKVKGIPKSSVILKALELYGNPLNRDQKVIDIAILNLFRYLVEKGDKKVKFELTGDTLISVKYSPSGSSMRKDVTREI